MVPELLSPAGNLSAGYAALHYGADAVYLGMENFSARATAQNFTSSELDEFTAYAHSLTPRCNVYATVNTLIQQKEIPLLLSTLTQLRMAHIDAIIVQDFGVVQLLQKHFPEIAIHASTQMAVHNIDTAKFLRDCGVKRVTLARELTLAEIAAMAQIENLETEFFLHGALCYSYSGLCLFSSHLIGRSANRGRCVYPCREKFIAPNNRGYLFSMKDLSLAKYLGDLFATGVMSLKIEGRKKSALYVAAVVDFYRQLFDGKLNDDEITNYEEKIRSIFSREQCGLFINNQNRGAIIDHEYVGHRGTPTGKVKHIITRARKKYLCFHTRTAIENYDGLQLNIGDDERPFGFSVQDLSVIKNQQWTPTFTAPANCEIAVLLPDDAPIIPLNCEIYRASSQAVKRKYTWHTPRPRDFRNVWEIAVNVTFTPTEIIAQASFITDDNNNNNTPQNSQTHLVNSRWAIAPITCKIAGVFALAKNREQITDAVKTAFAKVGDYAFCLRHCEIANPEHLFAPVSLLNQLRRETYNALTAKMLLQFDFANYNRAAINTR